jgi:tRNA/rRNA methyltransferase
MLRRILGRAGLTPREVQTLRGIIRKTERKMGYAIKDSDDQKLKTPESMEKFI